MRILLTGASGFVGRYLLDALQQHHTVIACTHRKPLTMKNTIQSLVLDFSRMKTVEDWLPYLQGIDVVINTVGIIAETKTQSFANLHTQAPLALFKACEQLGVKRVIQLSALGADDTATVAYHLSKKAADDGLKKRNLEWFVLRPSLIYGRGGKSFALFQWISNLPIIPLLEHGQQMLQPVHISDVVAAVLRCLEKDVKTKQTVNVVGERAISYRDWMLVLRRYHYKPLFLPMPFATMALLSRVGKYIHLPLLNPDSLQMLQQHNVADSRPLTGFLGRKPLSVRQHNTNEALSS